MPRFAVLEHTVVGQLCRTTHDHLDWMFEVQGVLRTFATEVIESFDQGWEIEAEAIADHRLAYLDFEGEVSGKRGTVRRILAGDYTELTQSENEFSIEIRWDDEAGTRTAQADFYRIFNVNCFTWRLRFAP